MNICGRIRKENAGIWLMLQLSQHAGNDCVREEASTLGITLQRQNQIVYHNKAILGQQWQEQL